MNRLFRFIKNPITIVEIKFLFSILSQFAVYILCFKLPNGSLFTTLGTLSLIRYIKFEYHNSRCRFSTPTKPTRPRKKNKRKYSDYQKTSICRKHPYTSLPLNANIENPTFIYFIKLVRFTDRQEPMVVLYIPNYKQKYSIFIYHPKA